MKKADSKNSIPDGPSKEIYLRQNKMLHLARQRLNMSLEDLREMARAFGGKASISSLSLEQRRELIDMLIQLGADVENPALPEAESNLYLEKLEGWMKRFPRPRAGFATNEQLALIEDLWERFFEDGRPGRGLRGFLVRQCGIDALEFLLAKDVKKIITALKTARKRKTNDERYRFSEAVVRKGP